MRVGAGIYPLGILAGIEVSYLRKSQKTQLRSDAI